MHSAVRDVKSSSQDGVMCPRLGRHFALGGFPSVEDLFRQSKVGAIADLVHQAEREVQKRGEEVRQVVGNHHPSVLQSSDLLTSMTASCVDVLGLVSHLQDKAIKLKAADIPVPVEVKPPIASLTRGEIKRGLGPMGQGDSVESEGLTMNLASVISFVIDAPLESMHLVRDCRFVDALHLVLIQAPWMRRHACHLFATKTSGETSSDTHHLDPDQLTRYAHRFAEVPLRVFSYAVESLALTDADRGALLEAVMAVVLLTPLASSSIAPPETTDVTERGAVPPAPTPSPSAARLRAQPYVCRGVTLLEVVMSRRSRLMSSLLATPRLSASHRLQGKESDSISHGGSAGIGLQLVSLVVSAAHSIELTALLVYDAFKRAHIGEGGEVSPYMLKSIETRLVRPNQLVRKERGEEGDPANSGMRFKGKGVLSASKRRGADGDTGVGYRYTFDPTLRSMSEMIDYDDLRRQWFSPTTDSTTTDSQAAEGYETLSCLAASRVSQFYDHWITSLKNELGRRMRQDREDRVSCTTTRAIGKAIEQEMNSLRSHSALTHEARFAPLQGAASERSSVHSSLTHLPRVSQQRAKLRVCALPSELPVPVPISLDEEGDVSAVSGVPRSDAMDEWCALWKRATEKCDDRVVNGDIVTELRGVLDWHVDWVIEETTLDAMRTSAIHILAAATPSPSSTNSCSSLSQPPSLPGFSSSDALSAAHSLSSAQWASLTESPPSWVSCIDSHLLTLLSDLTPTDTPRGGDSTPSLRPDSLIHMSIARRKRGCIIAALHAGVSQLLTKLGLGTSRNRRNSAHSTSSASLPHTQALPPSQQHHVSTHERSPIEWLTLGVCLSKLGQAAEAHRAHNTGDSASSSDSIEATLPLHKSDLSSSPTAPHLVALIDASLNDRSPLPEPSTSHPVASSSCIGSETHQMLFELTEGIVTSYSRWARYALAESIEALTVGLSKATSTVTPFAGVEGLGCGWVSVKGNGEGRDGGAGYGVPAEAMGPLLGVFVGAAKAIGDAESLFECDLHELTYAMCQASGNMLAKAYKTFTDECGVKRDSASDGDSGPTDDNWFKLGVQVIFDITVAEVLLDVQRPSRYDMRANESVTSSSQTAHGEPGDTIWVKPSASLTNQRELLESVFLSDAVDKLVYKKHIRSHSLAFLHHCQTLLFPFLVNNPSYSQLKVTSLPTQRQTPSPNTSAGLSVTSSSLASFVPPVGLLSVAQRIPLLPVASPITISSFPTHPRQPPPRATPPSPAAPPRDTAQSRPRGASSTRAAHRMSEGDDGHQSTLGGVLPVPTGTQAWTFLRGVQESVQTTMSGVRGRMGQMQEQLGRGVIEGDEGGSNSKQVSGEVT
eukprot:GHVN01015570.1.p1 GENE.GHVN01015570.1~~GHVN01015570.1.p1  ORF type:complete len:1346 (-),score=320.41 GHVN01015570.1:160-4197(-)